jgi:hypothetical protein
MSVYGFSVLRLASGSPFEISLHLLTFYTYIGADYDFRSFSWSRETRLTLTYQIHCLLSSTCVTAILIIGVKVTELICFKS